MPTPNAITTSTRTCHHGAVVSTQNNETNTSSGVSNATTTIRTIESEVSHPSKYCASARPRPLRAWKRRARAT